MSRADTSKYEREPFYLYIDEFQTFTNTVTASYEKILSRARKYGLGLILAHQQTHQIPLELLREIMGNVSTIVSFQVSGDDASKLSKELITQYNGEVLKTGQAYCKIGQNSFFMQTYLADQAPDHNRANYIISQSRRNYGVNAKKEKPTETRKQKDFDDEDIDPSRVF